MAVRLQFVYAFTNPADVRGEARARPGGLMYWARQHLDRAARILGVPAFRNRIPVILDEVTTLCGPGELIDVIATERGLCINPRRAALVEAAKETSVPILEIHDLKREVERICGGSPQRAKTTEKVVAAIQWVDGTTIDCVQGLGA